jgi:hypothetical protein
VNVREGSELIGEGPKSVWRASRDMPGQSLRSRSTSVGMGVYPTDTDQRALVLIKTNADDGVLQGALIYELQTVELQIDGERFKVAKSNKVGADGTIDMHDVFTKKKRQSGQDGKTTRAKEALLEDGWMPTNPDDSQDSDWIAVKLRELSGVSLHPKNVAKLMPELYEEGFVNFVPAKKGPGGHKDRWYLTL